LPVLAIACMGVCAGQVGVCVYVWVGVCVCGYVYGMEGCKSGRVDVLVCVCKCVGV
jgi:hypothetical protein